MKTLLSCLGFMLCAMFAAAAGIQEGMSLLEVETQLGKPLSSLNKGDVTVLLYPNQGRVELVAGKVVRMSRVPYFDGASTPAAAATESRADVAQPKLPPQPQLQEKAPPDEPEIESEWAANTRAQRELEAVVERMANPPEADANLSLAQEFGLVATPAHFWLELFVALIVQIGVGMVVLKLAFAWTEVHADWGQMFLPALVAALSGALVRGSVYAIWSTDKLFYLDDAVSYGALFFTLLKATHACTWQRAAGVAMASKLLSMVIWVFLSVALSQALFA